MSINRTTIYRCRCQADNNSDACHKVEIYILTSVGKGVIGAGVSCADTIAMEAELIRMDVIESFIFD